MPTEFMTKLKALLRDKPKLTLQACCFATAGLGVLVLIGWAFDIMILKSIAPTFVTMKANTALGLIILSVALLLITSDQKKWQTLGKCLVGSVGIIAILTLCEYTFNINIGIDELLFKDPMGITGRFPSGRLAPITAICFILLTSAFLLIHHPKKKLRSIGQIMVLISNVASLQAIVGYLIGVTYSFGLSYYTQMALHTAGGLVLISIAYLISCRNDGLMFVLTKATAGGKSARRIVLTAIVTPPLVHFIEVGGLNLGLFDPDLAILFRIMGNMTVFVAIAWRDSINLHDLDEERRHKNFELLTTNMLLNQTIKQQTESLFLQEKMLKELLLIQNELKSSREDFQHIAESIPQMVWTMDSERNITYLNQRGLDFLGCELTAAFRFAPYVHPGDMPTAMEHWQKALTLGIYEETEVRYRGIDGIYRWHVARLISSRDSKGKIVKWIGTAVDIHVRKTQMEELQAARVALELAQDAAQLGTWTYDFKTKIVRGTHFFFKLHGFPDVRSECLPEQLLNSIQAEDRSLFESKWQNSDALDLDSYELEFRTVWPDGSLHWIGLMARVVRGDEGKVAHHLGIAFDVTALHDAREDKAQHKIREEAAIESSRLKSEFLATMSHEIRTPINGVMGMTNILLDTTLTADQREYGNAIKRSGNALLTVINDILDFSKIEANKLDFEEIDFNFTQAIDDAYLATRFMAEKKGLKVEIDIDRRIPPLLNGDPGRFQQIITNLLSNAVKFTPAGIIKVRAILLEQSDKETTVRVEVIDTGVGIAEDSKSKLFKAFSQADSSTTRKFGGTGLGLSISRHLVQRMAGDIGVESEIGKGSTFWFTARLKTAATVMNLVNPEVNPASASAATRRSRILIAEDVQINQIVAIRMVEKLGHYAHVVANGKEVIDALHNGDYDLILMDCHMPELDGYQATSLIRASKTVPNPGIFIVAMTANAMKGDKEKCMEVGMNDYVSKPVEPKSLEKILNKWLNGDGQGKFGVSA